MLKDMAKKAESAGKKKATQRTVGNAASSGNKISWGKHGPEFFRLLEELETAYDAADTVPDSIGDIVTWYKQYKEDKKLTASAGK